MSLNDFDDSQFEDFSQEPETTSGGFRDGSSAAVAAQGETAQASGSR